MQTTQHQRALGVLCPVLGEDALLLMSATIRERFSGLFEARLRLVSSLIDLTRDRVIGQPMTVWVERHDGERRPFNGLVSEFSLVKTEGRTAWYEAKLVPWLWFLTLRSECRIFQNQRFPDIFKTICREHGFSEVDDALNGEYRSWEYCVQYRETDFAFLSRLMEQEGVYYYFEHEEDRHIMVLADGYSSHDTVRGYESVPYYPPDAHVHRQRDHLVEWQVHYRARPSLVALNDYDFKVPMKDLYVKASEPNDPTQQHSEIYDYPGEYTEADDGSRYVRMRMEELFAGHEELHGRGDACGLGPGVLFSMEGHPRDDQNREYLVTSMTHELRSDEYRSGDGADEPVYRCELTAIPAEVPYRPPCVTPRPYIRGPQTAFVTGKEGSEIWTDEFGRVKVIFHWDRFGEANENSSCWVRVASAWAGKHWGQISLPRVGQEVIVEFEEGDPDRPIVTGRVYNGESMPPYTLPDQRTISTNKSLSSPDGGGFNEVRFEDKKDEEQVFIHAQKQMDVRVKENCYETTEGDRHVKVEGSQRSSVGGARHDQIGGNHNTSVGGDRQLTVKGDEIKEMSNLSVHASTAIGLIGDTEAVLQSGSLACVTGPTIAVYGFNNITLKSGGSSIVLTGGGIWIEGPVVNINSGRGPGAAGRQANPMVPAGAAAADPADIADPGDMAEIKRIQRENKFGKYGKEPGDKTKVHWIEIVLEDEMGRPVPYERYICETPDGYKRSGALDKNGFAREDRLAPGACRVTFPRLDAEAWMRK